MFTTTAGQCRPSRLGLIWALGAACMLPTCLGFSVDDAFIVSRVASNGASGLGFGFNPNEPSDAVTPFGYAHLLALIGLCLGKTSAGFMFASARLLGVMSFLGAWYLAGRAAAERNASIPVWLSILLPLVSLPLTIWAGAGLSPPLVAFLLMAAFSLAVRDRAVPAGFCLAVALGLRLELVPVGFSALVAVGARDARYRSRLAKMTGIVLLWLLLLGCLRLYLYGRPLPLAFTAKAPDFASGLRYALVTALWGGLPWLLLSRAEFWKFKSSVGIGFLFLVHLVALVYAGGDWMPGLRLSAPLFPVLAAVLAPHLRLNRALLLPALGATLGPLLMLKSQGADYRAVLERRHTLVAEGAPLLKGEGAVAALDVGWVGLATKRRIFDLAGVTLFEVAELPGGHTSKQIPGAMFHKHDVQTWVVRTRDRVHEPGQELSNLHPVYEVDFHLMRQGSAKDWESIGTLPLPGTEGQYVVLRLKKRP